jgi:TolB-like protein
MPSASDHTSSPSPPLPSVFISYAAEDRAAVRTLRDTLAAAGLDVWYDENELSGGDAWDRKIRRQIRDCEYFIPVISASTEARKEGYFRREWRLAVERTLDMADDVLFLLPIALDDTPEMGARVPEKFLSVQWLRAPAGKPTPALNTLLERLRAGDHRTLPRSSAGSTRAPFAYHRTTAPVAMPPPAPQPPVLAADATPRSADAQAHAPQQMPPMPPLPQVPEKGGFLHGVKFIAEVLWWALTAAWLLFIRLPKWARILVTLWLVVTLFSTRCSRSNEPPAIASPSRTAPVHSSGEGQKKIRQGVERAASAAREGGFTLEKADLGRIAAEIAHVFGDGFIETSAAGKTIVIIPFAPPSAETPGGKFAHGVFLSLYGRLSLARRNEIGVVSPLRAEPIPEVLLARATALGASFVLAASPVAEGEDAALNVKLFSVADSAVAWTESFPIKGADSTAVAETIAAQVFERLPRKEPRRPK